MTSDGPVEPTLRHSDPPRPSFATGIPLRPEIRRPRIVDLVLILVVFAGIAFLPFTIDAVPRRQQIRSKLEDELAKQSPDYSAADIEQAVLITLIGLVAVSVLFVVTEIRSAARLRRKSRGGRTWLLILTVLHLPVIAMSPFIRDGGRWDLISAATQGTFLVLGTLLAYVPPVSKWLRKVKRQGPIPLRTSSDVKR